MLKVYGADGEPLASVVADHVFDRDRFLLLYIGDFLLSY